MRSPSPLVRIALLLGIVPVASCFTTKSVNLDAGGSGSGGRDGGVSASGGNFATDGGAGSTGSGGALGTGGMTGTGGAGTGGAGTGGAGTGGVGTGGRGTGGGTTGGAGAGGAGTGGTGTGGRGTGGAGTGGAGTGGAGTGGAGTGGAGTGGAGTGGASTGGAGTGGAGTGGAGTGGAGTGGAGACGNLIDDMENGTGNICQGNGRSGRWFSYRDAASTLQPDGVVPAPSVVSPPRDASTRAVHAYGTFVQYAGLGCFLATTPATYNANAFTGIRFYAKGTATKVIVQTATTISTTYGGKCTLATLTCAGNETPIPGLPATDWTLAVIPFSSLTNGTAAFDRSDIWSIEFQSGPGAFDFWIDDISFY